ncbi:hypothetical protein [Salmonirosea aquatica]|uniref:Uncharacterized protein n=1 Tax=Salmonirosea aquatica TaxID=2654236 RepID=A0A7C9FQ40_9BACT|nr:hypothetical protein [Cytophagaceae bacterium SJW1-29]
MSFTDATHGWVIGELGSILAYHPAAEPCFSAPIVVESQSIAQLSTLTSGNWNSPAVWSCGTIPTTLDDVRINSEHTITLPAGYSAASKSIELMGKIQQDANTHLRLGQE